MLFQLLNPYSKTYVPFSPFLHIWPCPKSSSCPKLYELVNGLDCPHQPWPMECWSVQYKASVTVPDSTSPERYEPPYILRFEIFVLFITLAMGISHPSSLIISFIVWPIYWKVGECVASQRTISKSSSKAVLKYSTRGIQENMWMVEHVKA